MVTAAHNNSRLLFFGPRCRPHSCTSRPVLAAQPRSWGLSSSGFQWIDFLMQQAQSAHRQLEEASCDARPDHTMGQTRFLLACGVMASVRPGSAIGALA